MPGVDTDEEREATFWHTCVPMRIVLATTMTIAALQDVRALQLVLGVFMGSWGVAFFANFVKKCCNEARVARALAQTTDPAERARLERQRRTTMHGNFGGVVWWQFPRLVHGALLVAYAVTTLFLQWREAYVFAIADVAFGVVAGLWHYRLRCGCDFGGA
jgi:hypothetical protein